MEMYPKMADGGRTYPSRDVTFIIAVMNSFMLYVKGSIVPSNAVVYACHLGGTLFRHVAKKWAGIKREPNEAEMSLERKCKLRRVSYCLEQHMHTY